MRTAHCPPSSRRSSDGVNLNHPLMDGNKRLCWVCAVIFAQRNGFDLANDVDDAEKMIITTTAGNVAFDQLTTWVADHLRPIRGTSG